jgi:hypothetical protein
MHQSISVGPLRRQKEPFLEVSDFYDSDQALARLRNETSG